MVVMRGVLRLPPSVLAAVAEAGASPVKEEPAFSFSISATCCSTRDNPFTFAAPEGSGCFAPTDDPSFAAAGGGFGAATGDRPFAFASSCSDLLTLGGAPFAAAGVGFGAATGDASFAAVSSIVDCERTSFAVAGGGFGVEVVLVTLDAFAYCFTRAALEGICCFAAAGDTKAPTGASGGQGPAGVSVSPSRRRAS